MYRLYIANKNYSSWSLRVWVLMRAAGIDFEERLLPFGESAAWMALQQLSPNGKVPCLLDQGLCVWDSLAIIEYLAERHAGIWPHDPSARAWARSAAAEMHSGFETLRTICSMNCGVRVRLRELPAALERDLRRLSALWSDGLRRFGGPCLSGSHFTAVDACFCPVAFRVQSYGLELPAVAASYARRLLDLPAMRQWYAEALQEPWRDAAHEQELTTRGAITADLRA